jgi:hypothetical protein
MAVEEAAPRYRRINHPSLDERLDQGRTARDRTSPSSHAGWSPAADRPDPAGLAEDGPRLSFDLNDFDMKGSALVELMASITLTHYARLCGWTLARTHARSGDPVAMAEYLAGDDAVDLSITDFCGRYADQNEQDYGEFGKAVRSGCLEAAEGV